MTVDHFGDPTEAWEPTNAQIIDYLLTNICPAGEPHTSDDPTTDHGHTHCMWLFDAIAKAKRNLTATPVDNEIDCKECQGTGLADGPDGPPRQYCDGSGVW